MADADIKPQRIALVIQYQGTNFHGWQRQSKHRTVQEEIEKVLKTVEKRSVTLYGAGRTDTGVHAAAQIAHFESFSYIPPQRWAGILNARLPQDIGIRASAAVDANWHAQYSAIWRRYRYTIYTDAIPNLFVQPYTWHYYYQPLDERLIQAALQPLLGNQHLSAFRRAGSARRHSWVEVQEVQCYRCGPFLHIEVQASGFLYGMMRLLVGLLVQVGRGDRTLENFQDIWTNERRELVKYAAPSQGLCLLRVGYPESPFPPDIWFDTMPKFLLPTASAAETSCLN